MGGSGESESPGRNFEERATGGRRRGEKKRTLALDDGLV